jgi:hypothetical protein
MSDRATEIVTEMQDVYDLIIATCEHSLEFKAWGASALRFLNKLDPALAAAARQGGDVKQAPGEAPQSGGDSRNAQPEYPKPSPDIEGM